MYNLVKRATAVALAAACLLSACQTLPGAASVHTPPPPATLEDGSAARAAMNARVHDGVMRAVTRNFYDRHFNGVDFAAEVAARRDATIAQPNERGFYTALNETLGLLNDGHTFAIRPTVHQADQRRALQTSGTFGFVHTALTDSDTGETSAFVVRVRKGGPADEAGVRPGWRVLTLNGEPWDAPWPEGRPFEGLTFVVGFLDLEGRRHDIPLESRLMPREIGTAERRPDGVLVLRLGAFDEAYADWLEDRLAEALTDPPRAIVLDMRANGGGRVDFGARILGGFFRERPVFARYRAFWMPIRYRIQPASAVWDGPMAVVQSEESGSMAEVFSATIQEQRRGLVVGQRSAGHVVMSVGFNLPDGGILSVGRSEVRTGRGAVLERVGVEPDIFSERTYAQARVGRDDMIEAAVAALLAQPAP